MTTHTLHRGTAPLLISLPHDGTELPAGVVDRMTEAACRVPDTDWHVARLYAFALELDASILTPRYSRYLVDLNRPSDGHALYPGRRETGLCPTVTFSGEPIYREGAEPGAAEIAERVVRYWQPYHHALAGELERLRNRYGRVTLWEGHSIRGEVPMFFSGRLPDLNLGTGDGASCSPVLRERLMGVLAGQSRYDWVADARFKGGYITRHYGEPDSDIDAVQMEIAQRNYMDEDSFAWRADRAAQLQPVLRALLERCV